MAPPLDQPRTFAETLALLAVDELTSAAVNLGLVEEPQEPALPRTPAEAAVVRLAPSVRALALRGGFSTLKELAQRLRDAHPG